MTKEQKRRLFEPHWWGLYENGELIDTFPSHKEAKKARHFKIVEADMDMLDLDYQLKKL